MKMRILIFSVLGMFWSLVCPGNTKEITINDRNQRILSILSKEYNDIKDFMICDDIINNVSLFWSDPGYIKGPTMMVECPCWKISFTTDTYNDNGTIKYTDYYKFYICKNDSIIYKRNNYQGHHYHGGSFIMFVDANDVRFPEITKPLKQIKPVFITDIELILKQ